MICLSQPHLKFQNHKMKKKMSQRKLKKISPIKIKHPSKDFWVIVLHVDCQISVDGTIALYLNTATKKNIEIIV